MLPDVLSVSIYVFSNNIFFSRLADVQNLAYNFFSIFFYHEIDLSDFFSDANSPIAVGLRFPRLSHFCAEVPRPFTRTLQITREPPPLVGVGGRAGVGPPSK